MNNSISQHSKKILFACVPADGHFSPLTGLAKHLQSEGYDVRWYTASKYEAKLRKLQIPAFRFTKAMDITADDVDEFFPERRKIKGSVAKLNFDLEHFFIRRGPEYYADLQDIHKIFPFDLLIADVLFTGSIFVKELLKVPVISVGVFPLMETSKDLAPSGLGMVPSTGLAGRIKQSLLRFMTKNILFRKTNRLFHLVLEAHGIKHDNVFMFDLLSQRADFMLQSGTPAFEYERSDLSRNVKFIGPLLPFAAEEDREPWYDERVNKYQGVVLATQGTVEKDVNKLLIPAMEAFKDTNILLICTTGGSQTAELRAKYPQENIIIEDFIPFGDVMPYADVYVTNGGYGGVLLGIQNRLPLVVAGVHEGKNEICARVGYFKYGINLKTENPLPVQLQEAVQRVISNPVYRLNVERLSIEFEKYNPNELCEKYVSGLLQPGIISREKVNRIMEEICF